MNYKKFPVKAVLTLVAGSALPKQLAAIHIVSINNRFITGRIHLNFAPPIEDGIPAQNIPLFSGSTAHSSFQESSDTRCGMGFSFLHHK